jgi:hypothetical protein
MSAPTNIVKGIIALVVTAVAAFMPFRLWPNERLKNELMNEN